MRPGVDLAPQDLLGPGHGQRGNLCAQRLLGTKHFLFDLGFGAGELALTLGFRGVLRFLNKLGRALVGLGKKLLRFVARFDQDFLGALRRPLELLLAALRGGKPRRRSASGARASPVAAAATRISS